MSIELGKFNQLEVVKEVDFGVYLDGGEEGEILLPTRYVPEDCKIGDFLNVFLYLDMDERLIATTLTPLVQVGQFACLEVSWVNQYGAFLNWGLMKDLFVPFREQKMKMQVGRKYVVHAHVDEESYRIVASAKVERYLSKEKPEYAPGAEVNILIWQKTDLGFIKEHGGRINLNDKSPAEDIYDTFGVSKKTFKKGVGDLYKKRLITLHEDGIALADS